MTTFRTTDRPARFLPVLGLLLLLYACCAAPGWAVAPERTAGAPPPPGDPEGGFGYMDDYGGSGGAHYVVHDDAQDDSHPLPGIGIWVPEAGIFILPTAAAERAWWAIPAQLMFRYRGSFTFR